MLCASIIHFRRIFLLCLEISQHTAVDEAHKDTSGSLLSLRSCEDCNCIYHTEYGWQSVGDRRWTMANMTMLPTASAVSNLSATHNGLWGKTQMPIIYCVALLIVIEKAHIFFFGLFVLINKRP